MNSGKTTVAKLLVKNMPRTAHVEKLRQFIEWMPIEESRPYNIQNIISLTRNFIEIGNLNVVISYPVSSKNFKFISESLSNLKQSVYAFTLSPRLDVVIKNRGTRELADWEIKQIQKSYAEGIQKPDYGIIIDNSNEIPEETVKKILTVIG